MFALIQIDSIAARSSFKPGSVWSKIVTRLGIGLYEKYLSKNRSETDASQSPKLKLDCLSDFACITDPKQVGFTVYHSQLINFFEKSG